MPEDTKTPEPLDTAVRAHHPDSPSSLQSSEACPKFVNEQRESPAAAAGTLQHKAVETRDLSILDGNPEQIAAVQKCIDYEDAVIAAHADLQWQSSGPFLRDRVHHYTHVVREVKLQVGDDDITSGFPDTVIMTGRVADLLDWKFGKVPVTPTKTNLQGIAYALGLFERYPQLAEVSVHFFAPYQGWTEKQHNDKYVHPFYRSEIPALELRVRTVIARKYDVTSQPSPRNDLCLWCANKGSCPELHATVLQISDKYDIFTAPTVVNPSQLSKPEQYKAAFRFANQVESWAKAVKSRCRDAFITENLELGDDIKLVRRVERRITSPWELIKTARQHGIGLKEIVGLLTVPITKLEEAIKKKAPKGGGAAAIRAFQADLTDGGIVVPCPPIFFLQEVKAPAEKKQNIIEIEAYSEPKTE